MLVKLEYVTEFARQNDSKVVIEFDSRWQYQPTPYQPWIGSIVKADYTLIRVKAESVETLIGALYQALHV